MGNHKKQPGLPKQDVRERISVQAGPNTVNRISGDSVDEHRRIESANNFLAEKEIKQTFNNS
ncbi:hypothetical protein [Oceanobacillus damuensis]|uniref:hypothetical protein n=1 Tax=Oceanobacillus damuensis TaxID=937928 RepID=UPI00082AEFC2|nr:hypothetical protein [Oceanobacillus damuensis]